ncbi:hypothetical protein Pfo_014193 [Paulownia fortunei]|nr:hypothetical protein Pfo_014193 [Paulownia fortunei]
MNTLSLVLLLLTYSSLIIQTISGATEDTINTTQIIRDGETMISSGGMFELGFFSRGNSTNRYVGMWFKNISVRTVIWVANRQVPLPNKSGVLKVTEPGILVLLNDTNGTIWSSNTSRSVQNPVAQLLDSGNLVVRDAATDPDNPENYLWQSFDYPTDTYLPGMRFGWNFVTGDYTYYLDPTGYPQIFMAKNGVENIRIGPWNGLRFSGTTNAIEDPTYKLILVMNENEVNYREYTIDRSVISRFTLSQSGVAQRWTWVGRTQEWRIYLNVPADNCDSYKLCGAYGSCNIGNSPSCGCLDKFVPKDPGSWVGADWSSGCIRRTNLSCQGDVFLKYSGIKLPDTRHTRQNENLTLEECRAECLRNCSCMAYTQLDLSKQSGCLFWFEDLLDIRDLYQDGQDIYVRMASSELESEGKKPQILIGSLTSGIAMVLLALSLFLYIQKRRKDSRIRKEGKYSGSNQEDPELSLFKYSVILKATNKFSDDNKLGEGGFGPVFKGTLEDGQEIAVKRLSSTSSQGIDEFKNEVIFIAKLQHRNLVRLLGCCIQGDENMLIYEYMPHKSLDVVLFDQTRNLLRDWPKRFHIINGIARGLLYLHQDSRLRIIHRDLKASNVLLDSDLNPKISDFGTARSFGGNETAAKTRRVVGTYGYMSPEYAVDGLFSVKSDVFSFGVLVLEIVSGKRNRGFSHSDHHLNLLGHAWTLYKEERTLELVDASLADSFDLSEVLRSIHVGLLCVQKKTEDRPNMSSVVLMLGNEGVLPAANQPGFFTEREVIAQSSTSTTNSTNEISLLLIIPFLLSTHRMLLAMDTINTTQIFRDGETMLSSGGSFELGFFSPGNSKNWYVGIWYKRVTVRTVVWVANREIPLRNTSGVLKVIEPGILVLLNEANDIIWSTNTSSSVRTPVAQLLDSGNLVVKDANDDNPENFLWQSFNYPTDTLLPGMKLGWNFMTPGDFTYHCDPSGYPQNILRKGEVEQYRTGPWNGLRFSGTPNLRKNPIFRYELVLNKNEVYYHYELLNSSVVSRLTLSQSGVAQRWTWIDRTQGWVVYLTTPTDNCDIYKLCGAYGSCNVANSPVCGCLNKFVPKDPDGWNRADWSNGCVRRTPLNCQNGDAFLKYSGIKLPDTKHSWFNESMNLEECKVLCLKNCSCMAYSNLDISRGANGCLLWFDDLVDIKELSAEGQDIYIRMASSELGSKGMKQEILIVTLLPVLGIVLLGLSLMLYLQKRKKIARRLRKRGKLRLEYVNNHNDESHNKDLELPLFDLHTLTKATDNFSINNKLGEGGFGPVYKGQLEEGQEIAVKRLSRTSLQGVDEFKNEVICIAKLQHRNLVKLVGCCIQGEENMLVYEYMTNKSLDLILFDPLKSTLLDWPKRFHIINGIARGLMYLHQDSRLRIIHRDLKASNILLDSEMNPKISDFGLARTFGGNETGANTSRVVGTYGYMSPEYAVDGLFSVKSDVFSFGVLVLEIVSGKRNRGFSHRDHNLNLLGHAWMLYKEGRSLELVDSYVGNSCYLLEVLRSIQVGLLCVQQCPDDRPSMSSVVLMLGNDGALPQANQPGFFTGRDILNAEISVSSNAATSSTNEIIILPLILSIILFYFFLLSFYLTLPHSKKIIKLLLLIIYSKFFFLN